jgi:hypothetical protein
MQYDHRYTPLLQWAGLHVVAQVVRRGLPNFNTPALTALIDKFTLNLCPHDFYAFVVLHYTYLYCRFL